MAGEIDPMMIVFAVLLAGGAAIVLFLWKKKKPGEYKVKPFQENNYKELKETIKRNGTKKSFAQKGWKLFIGFNCIAHIQAYYFVTGKHEAMAIDNKLRKFRPAKTDEGADKDFKLIHMLAHPQNWFMRQLNKFLGVWYDIYTIDADRVHNYDAIDRVWVMRNGEDFTKHGRTWTNSSEGMERINTLAIRRMTEEVLTLAENFGPRVMYLEIANARTANRLFTDAKATKDKYDGAKSADDTQTVS